MIVPVPLPTQLRLVLPPPNGKVDGDGVNTTVGAIGGLTVTVLISSSVPPGPVAVTRNNVVWVTVALKLVALEPAEIALLQVEPPLVLRSNRYVNGPLPVVLQVRFCGPPPKANVGIGVVKVTIGAVGEATVTVTSRVVVPPALVAVKV